MSEQTPDTQNSKKSNSKKKAAPKKKAAAKKTSTKSKSNGAAQKSSPKEEAVKSKASGSGQGYAMPDLSALSKNASRIMTESQDLLSRFTENMQTPEALLPIDVQNITKAFGDLLTSLTSDPEKFWQAQTNLWQTHLNLWQNTARRLMGEDTEPLIEPQRSDKRFRDDDWHERLIFDFIKQSYLLTANWLQETVDDVEGMEDHEHQKLEFFTKQFVDAISPSNFVMTNPQVLRETLKTSGQNLVDGLENLLEDLERGDGKLNIRQTDMEYFKVGENIATTPGKVVFQNELFQLLQYNPTTEKVFEIPMLIFPPWINKFYILDLREDNSFIKWLTAQGYTVFVVSWINPGAHLADKTFEDYMFQGILEAIDAVKDATGQEKVNAIGYCIGGTLLGASLSYMATKEIDRINSATFFTAQVDFTEAGELLVFIDEEQLQVLEKEMDATGGYLEGTSMAQTFNMLRSNDLIWSYVVNNYLMGKDPMRFDLLYWNADSTRMPKALHLYYLRECYLNNALAEGKMVFDGTTLDLSNVKVPVFLQSSKEDHIAPYRSVYKGTKLYGGPVTFMMAGSGHIAGVVNPPSANKYQHWTNPDITTDVDTWIANAEEHPGSWWPYWEEWLRQYSGKKIKARVPGDGKLEPLEDAPGSYVKVRAG